MVPNKSNWRQRRINCENSSVPLCRGPFLIRDSFIYFSCCRRWAICKLLSDCLHVVCLCLNDRGYPSLLKILKIKFKGGDEAGLKSLYVCFAWGRERRSGQDCRCFRVINFMPSAFEAECTAHRTCNSAMRSTGECHILVTDSH